MQYIKPDPLKKGDLAVLISPAGYIDPMLVDMSRIVLESWDLNVEISENAKSGYGRYAGTVEQRLQDIRHAMDREDARMIFCTRGGYGAIHYLDKLCFENFYKNPKWLVGFSDITALHQLFLKNRILSLHGPMARDIVKNENSGVVDFMKDTLFTGSNRIEFPYHPLNREGDILGRLFGGNLSVFCGLLGSEYISVPRNGILFIEDVAEPPYKIDRMMWSLKYSGILSEIKGLIVGRFSDCKEEATITHTVYELIKGHVAEYNYPVAFDFPLGHVSENYSLIHGGEYLLDVWEPNVSLVSNY